MHRMVNMGDVKEMTKREELHEQTCHKVYQDKIAKMLKNVERRQIDYVDKEWVHSKEEFRGCPKNGC